MFRVLEVRDRKDPFTKIYLWLHSSSYSFLQYVKKSNRVKADNLVCCHLNKLRKLIKNKSKELDDYDKGEDLVSEEGNP